MTRKEVKKRNNTIRAKRASGKSTEELVREYGLSRPRIMQITHGMNPPRGRPRKPIVEPQKQFTVKVNVPQNDVGAILATLAQRNYQFTVSA